MKCVIPYRHSNKGQELRYCLRSIEKYINNPQVVIIGDLPKWIRNIKYIPYAEQRDLRRKEKNIFEKLRLIKEDFLYFNDDHYLLEPFTYDYHYSGYLKDVLLDFEKQKSQFAQTIRNTIDIFGNIKNYYRHQPMLINVDTFKKINVDWNVPWGFCIKSIYCHLAGIEGEEYPDLKIREPTGKGTILKLIKDRPYFSTNEAAMNYDMGLVLEGLFSNKSKYET